MIDESEEGIEFARCDGCDRTLEYIHEEWRRGPEGLQFCPTCVASDIEEGRVE